MRRIPPAPDIPAILTTLLEHDVRFVVIGGVAVAHHGYVRATKDVDIVPEPGERNLRRLWECLAELEAEPLALGDLGPEELNGDLATRHGRLHVHRYVTGKLEQPDDYTVLAERADRTSFDFGTVLVAGYDDLLDFKNLAGRDQDLTDIRALREARGDIGPA
jgi:hypothetical protein